MEKLAAIASKMAHDRARVQRPVIQVDQINTPLPRCRVIEAERLRLDAKFLVGARDIELFKVGIAVEKFLVVRDAIILNPDIGVIEAVWKPAHMSFPVADKEIKIVGAITLRKICGIRTGLRRSGLTPKPKNRKSKTKTKTKKECPADEDFHFHFV